MKSSIHGLLVLASSLPLQFEEGEIHQCINGVNCKDMDQYIMYWHLSVPILIFVATMVILSLPTLLCNSESKDLGLIELCRCCTTIMAVLVLGLFSENMLYFYCLNVHAVSRLICSLNFKYLQGNFIWKNLKYFFVFILIIWIKYKGPRITSLVAWNEATPMICAYHSHLIAVLVTGQIEDLFCFIFKLFDLV